MSKDCSNCKHWECGVECNYDGSVDVDWGHCRKIPGPQHRHGYTRDDEDVLDDLSEIARTQDGSDYRASLVTHKSFYCIEWKANNDN